MSDGRSWVRRILRLGPPPQAAPDPAPTPAIIQLRDYREAAEKRRARHAKVRNETGNLLEFATLGGPHRRGR